MYKLIYNNKLVDGVDAHQAIGNLAQLLQLKPKVLRPIFRSKRLSVIKVVDTAAEAKRWRAAFLDAGVYLHVLDCSKPEAARYPDVIALELELHSIDDEPEEAPRQLLVERRIVTEDEPPAEIVAPARSKTATPAHRKNTPARGKSIPSAPVLVPAIDGALDTQPLASPSAPPSVTPPLVVKAPARTRQWFIQWSVAGLVLMLVVAGGFWVGSQRALWLPVNAAPQANAITNALANDALFALIHVDVQRLQQLPDVLRPGQGLKNVPGPEAHFWRKLEQANIAITQQLQHLWIASYRSTGQNQTLWVLNGEFTVDQWRGWLKKTYRVYEDSPQQIVFSLLDDNGCEKQPLLMALVSAQQIVLGAPEQVAAFRGRLDAQAPAMLELAEWHNSRSRQMLTLGLFKPAQFFGDDQGVIAFGAQTVNMAPVQAVYAGIAPRALMPRLDLELQMISADSAYRYRAQQNIAALLNTATTTMAQNWPDTLSIYKRMTLAESATGLHAAVSFDADIQTHLYRWVGSLLTHNFSMGSAAPAATEEQLEAQHRIFTAVSAADLPAFSSHKDLNPGFVAQQSVGPFGLAIRHLETTAQGVEIALEVNAFNLPNLGKAADAMQLRITDLVDQHGKSLLSAQTCDATGVRQPLPINLQADSTFVDPAQPHLFLGSRGVKTIVLPANINSVDIAAIKGELVYQLPTAIERIKLPWPLAGKIVETDAGELRFLAAGPSRLQFQYRGNAAALLQVNALNADGNVLASRASSRAANLLLEGQTTSIDVQGVINSAEVIVASELAQQRYTFTLSPVQPAAQPFAQEKSPPDVLTQEHFAALRQATAPATVQFPEPGPQQTTASGPALIALSQLRTDAQQLTLAADIYLHNQHPVARQLNVARLQISDVEDAAGTIHPVNIQLPLTFEHVGGSWQEGVFKPDVNQPWLRAPVVLSGYPLGVSNVVALWGELVFVAAAEPVDIQVPFLFGMQWHGKGAALTLTRWDTRELLFDLQGNFPDLVAITARDDQGVAISQTAELRSSAGTIKVALPVKQQPATITFSLAQQQETQAFPVEIRASQ